MTQTVQYQWDLYEGAVSMKQHGKLVTLLGQDQAVLQGVVN